MADKNKKRFARTPENILLAMGCTPTRDMKRRLREWMGWGDFPAKTRNGYDTDELFRWAETNAPKIAKQKKVGKMLQDGEDVNMADFKVMSLQTGGGKTFEVGADEFPTIAEGMDKLGALIMKRFAGRLPLQVGRQQIQNWKRLVGVAKRPGVVPFPAPKDSNRYNVAECFDWVEKWILPDTASTVGAGDLFGAGANIDVKIKETDLRRKLRLEQFEQGNLIPFGAVTSYIAGIAGRLSKYYERLIEDKAGVRRVVREAIEANGFTNPDLISAVDARLAEQLAKAHDDLKLEFAAARDFAMTEIEKIRSEQQQQN
jgi:hypothetical protein